MSAELEQIAASVARALGIKTVKQYFVCGPGDVAIPAHDETALWEDGSNLFSDHWRCACLDWLLQQRYDVHFSGDNRSHWHSSQPAISCPAAEFPARAIDALMRGKP